MMNAPKTIEDLPVPLTQAEILLKSKEHAKLSMDRAELEERKKLAAADFKNKIDSLEDRIYALVKEVHTGIELRPIECYDVPNYKDEMVETKRSDSHETIRSRPMHPTERQLALEVGELSPPKNVRPKRVKGDIPEGAH